MKKLISLALAVLMILSMATVVFATGGTEVPETGSITVTGIALKNGEPIAEYAVYKLLTVPNYSHDSTNNTTNIAYLAEDQVWIDFFTANPNFNVNPSTHYVTLIGTPDSTQVAKDTAAEAMAKIKEINSDNNENNDIDAICSTVNPNGNVEIVNNGETGNLIFKNLPLGYYLIVSDMGSLCGIDTTSPHGQIKSKNSPPTVTKRVQEDSLAGSDTASWDESNTADIGQVVKFDTTIVAQAGASKYVVHDTMEDSFTFNADTIEVYHLVASTSQKTPLTKGEDFTLKTECNDNCTFEVEFAQDFLDTIAANDQIILLYEATLNYNASIGNEDANENSTYVSYGNNFTTETDTTKTYTYRFDISKIDGFKKNLLDGAKFVLSNTNVMYDEEGALIEENRLPLVKMDPINDINTYHLYYEGMPGHDEEDIVYEIEVTGGRAIIQGVDVATYYLTETVAPKGYNLLSTPHAVNVNKTTNLVANDAEGNWLGSTYGVVIENNAGTELPSTGAMGTAMFITFGMFVVLGTGLLLVTKKRMSMIQE